MPNWINGSLKIRGPYENVKRFFMENLNTYEDTFDEQTQKWNYIKQPKEKWLRSTSEYGEAGSRELEICIEPQKWVYVEGTKRAFISSEIIFINERREKEKSIAACEINQAWGFFPEEWAELSKKYNVDIRLWGLECGLCFGQEIIIEHGELLKDDEFKYDDWTWEAPLPWLGG